MEGANGTIVECGVDWLTARAREDGASYALWKLGSGLVEGQAAAGFRKKVWTWMGFMGEIAGGVAYGQCDRGTVVILTGPSAQTWFKGVTALAENVTRLDLMVTVRLHPMDFSIARSAYSQGLAAPNGSHAKPKLTIIGDSENGSTLYVGTRTSDYYARLYNKEAESGEPEYTGCWRYETELKGAVADQLARLVANSADSRAFAAGYVHQHFLQRGITPAFTCRDFPVAFSHIQRTSDDDRTLAWLARCVAGKVGHLLGNGKLEDVLIALGLAEHARPYTANPPESDLAKWARKQ